MTAVSWKIRSEVVETCRRRAAGRALVHERPHVLDRPDRARQIATDEVVGEQGEGRRIVDLGDDELEGRGLERDGHDPIALADRREIRRRRVRVRGVADGLADAEEQVVLRLACDQEVPGRREEGFDVGVPVQLHGGSIGSAEASDGPSAGTRNGEGREALAVRGWGSGLGGPADVVLGGGGRRAEDRSLDLLGRC